MCVIQPCKKLRKDDDPPPAPTKSITNYFLPLPKPVDKPFTLPRSNSIVNYFRKTPPALERQSRPLQSKELQPSICEDVSPRTSRAPRQKQTRKAKGKPNKVQEEEEEQDVLTDNYILEIPDESIIKGEGSVSLLGSNPAALVSQINHEICLDEECLKSDKTTDVGAGDRKPKSQNRKSKNLATQSLSGDNFSKEDALSQENKGSVKKCAVRRNRKANFSQSETCNAENEQSVHDASMEVNVEKSSVLGCSTITMSFEEFLQSQMQDEVAAESKSDSAAESSEVKSCVDASNLVATSSPRTLTVQAEVHPMSPDHESVKGPQLKVASIFTKNKKEKPSSDDPQANTDVLPDPKRKSNVVLHEEDLELAVVESGSTPKCTQEEKKKFMNAFKQPFLDGSKGRPSKGLSKSKPGKDNASEISEPENKPDETNPDLATAELCTEQKKAKGTGKKKGRKPVTKGKAEKCEEVPVAPEHDKCPAKDREKEKANKTDSTHEHNGQSVKELRRSTRDQTRKQGAAGPETKPSPRKTRNRRKAETSAALQDDAAEAPTPKSLRRKKSVYRAEMLSPLETRESPIRWPVVLCLLLWMSDVTYFITVPKTIILLLY